MSRETNASGEQAATRIAREIQSADRLGALVTSAPKWTALAIVAWQIRLSIEALAGRNGLASLLQRFDRQTTTWELACWIAGSAGVLYGLYCRYLLSRLRAKSPTR